MDTIEYENKKQAHRRDVDTFVDVKLYPAIAENLADVFPEYHFTRNGATWYSRYDFSGSDTKKPGALYCTPTTGKPISIGGNGSRSGGIGGSGVEVLKLYAERHALSGRDEAAEEIAEVLGITGFPKWEGYAPGDSAKADTIDSDKVKAAAIFTKALEEGTTEGAKEARAYLLSRFTEEEYKQAVAKRLIGYADTETLAEAEHTAPRWHAAPLPSYFGTIHTIAVVTPYGSKAADSFNFRALPSKEAEAVAAGRSKYEMPTGTKRDILGGLPYGVDSVIAVEGEIDRLKATLAIEVENEKRKAANKPLLRGLNIVSVGTNQISEEKALNAVKRGVKRITIIPDSDSPKEVVDSLTGKTRLQLTHELPGEIGIGRSIAALYAAGIEEVYIAPLPTREDGGKVDTADFITAYGVEGWVSAVRSSKVAALPYIAEALLRKHIEEARLYGNNEEARDILFRELEALIYDRHATHDTAEKIYAVIKRYIEAPGNSDYFRFDLKAFRNYVEGRKDREAAAYAEGILRNTLADVGEKLKAGSITTAAAAKEVEAALADRKKTTAPDYSTLYATPTTPEEIEAGFTEVSPGVRTGIFLHTIEGEKKEVTIKEGVSLLVGARKHGKTTLLANIALREAKRNIEAHRVDITAPLKKVLLITYEVRKNRLQRDLLAIYLRATYGNFCGITKETIAAYYDKGIAPEDPTALHRLREGKAAFFRDYLCSGALTIIDLSTRKDVEELVALLKQYLSRPDGEGEVTLVALDYIQKLSTTRKEVKGNRPAELKHIGEALTDFGVANNLPILCAAQFNRISNLLQVDTTNIGEAGDLERNAVDVIGVFNLKELRALMGSEYIYGFGLHKNIFAKFGIPESEYLEYVPTGKRYAKDVKSAEGEIIHYAGEDITAPNIKPIRGKMYIALMASRFGGFPAEVVTDFEGATGYIDLDITDRVVSDSIDRVQTWERAKATPKGTYSSPTDGKEAAAGTDVEDPEEDFTTF